ncbi:MAG: LysM peptidoglycan-binding domain-containing protein [Elusimicrobiota bacterium]
MIKKLFPLIMLLAAVPADARSLLEMRGSLQDAAGNRMSGTYLLKVSLLDAVGGEKVWEETRYVRTVDGSFAAVIGDKKPIPEQLRVKGYRLKFEPPAGTGWAVRLAAAPNWKVGDAAPPPPPFEVPSVPPAPSNPSYEPAAVEPQVRAEERYDPPAQGERREIAEYKRRLEVLEQAVKHAGEPKRAVANLYVVQRSDTLRSIAQKLFGNSVHWIDIYRANSDRIRRGGELVPGQRLLIPKIAK